MTSEDNKRKHGLLPDFTSGLADALKQLHTSALSRVFDSSRIAESVRTAIGSKIDLTSAFAEANKSLQSSLQDAMRANTEGLKFALSSKIDLTSPLAEASKSLQSSLQDAMRTYPNMVKQFEVWRDWAAVNEGLSAKYKDLWVELGNQYKISEAEAIKILTKYKWLVTPSMPISFIHRVVQIGRKKGNQRGAINQLFIDYFTADSLTNLDQMVEGWSENELFAPRMKILRDCQTALKYESRKFNPSNLILPTLIAQIEGVQSDFMSKEGLFFCCGMKSWRDKESGKTIAKKEWFKQKTSHDDISELANHVFLDILFQKSLTGLPLERPFSFNRHKILHGEVVRYGRLDNTIRAFLILDFLNAVSDSSAISEVG